MSAMMNKDILEGRWKELRGRVKEQWGRLNDNQLDQIGGRYDQLVGQIQATYGFTVEKARQEVDRFIEKVSDKPH
jgi:uncharacterized protein YjbJ (UPF0337 family)